MTLKPLRATALLLTLLLSLGLMLSAQAKPLDPGEPVVRSPEANRWITRPIQYSGANQLAHAAIDVDADFTPHIAYRQDSALLYATLVGGQWITQTIDTVADWHVYTSIKLDQNGDAHVSYFDGEYLKYASRQAGIWQTQNVLQVGSTGRYDSLALDSQSQPRISFCYNGLKLAVWQSGSPGSWDIQELDSDCGGGDFGAETTLALDAGDRPHITYRGSGGLTYMEWDGLDWNSSVVTTTFTSPNLALDSAGRPHISFESWTPFVGPPPYIYRVHYAVWDGDEWAVSTVASNSIGVHLYSELAVSAVGDPVITYWDYYSWPPGYVEDRYIFYDFKMAQLTGDQWTRETLASFQGHGGVDYSPLILNSAGFPHILYMHARDANSIHFRYMAIVEGAQFLFLPQVRR